ncbi:Opi1-domain-containing protein [Phlegmacium glaucopus]|nr:Opi1-domain-containing protein [Phlegmacium glaucopus]
MEVFDEQEESAIRVLGDMRNRNGTSRTLPPLPRLSYDPSSDATAPVTPNSPAFVARMSHLPFLNSAIRVYEQGKASSRMVKYGAEMVESSVKSISRPVINRLPVDVNQLDEFACRQLDRLDRYRHLSGGECQPSASASPMATSPDPSDTDRERRRPKSKTKTLDGSPSSVEDQDDRDSSMQPEDVYPAQSSSIRHYRREGDKGVPDWLESNSPFTGPPPPPPDSRSSTPTQNGDESRSENSDPRNPNSRDERQVAQRSRWQAVLLEAGGLSAALSEESMRKLKYCLHWLQYATAYIDAHILFLRNFTADLQPLPSETASSTRRPPISEQHMRRLISVRRDIVQTIRQVVDIVSKYAGGALPEPAKTRVRGFILTLPQRWASKAGGGGGMTSPTGGSERDSSVTAAASGTAATRRPGGQRRAAQRERGTCSVNGIEGGLRSGTSSRAPSPTSPRISRNSHLRHGSGDAGDGENGSVPAGTALVAAQRILALATESLDMMRNVTGVVSDSLDRAEAWVGRLRTVGIQRGTQEVEDADTSEFEFSLRNNRRGHHRSGSSSQFDEHDLPSSPYLSGSSSTAWGSSIPSTPGGDTYTPAYVGSAPSLCAIPIGAMSLSSRYNTPRSGNMTLPDEEEEEEEEEVGTNGRRNDSFGVVNRKTQEREGGGGQVRVVGVDNGFKGLKMDVDE